MSGDSDSPSPEKGIQPKELAYAQSHAGDPKQQQKQSGDLQLQQGYVVPKGVVHRTRAPDRAVVLMVETAAIIPTGDAP